MKLQQLRYIVEVAACGSVTEAARRLFVSQPSVTAAVRDLEREMGITVFERTSKGMVTTTEGQTFLGYARQVLEQADLLEERFKRDTQPVPRFAVSCQHYSFAVNAFVDVIRTFNASRYEFTLREEQTHEIIEDVAHMKSELGVLYLSDANREVITRMLRAEELAFEPLSRPHRTSSSPRRTRWRRVPRSRSKISPATPTSPTSKATSTRSTSQRNRSPRWVATRTSACATVPPCSTCS